MTSEESEESFKSFIAPDTLKFIKGLSVHQIAAYVRNWEKSPLPSVQGKIEILFGALSESKKKEVKRATEGPPVRSGDGPCQRVGLYRCPACEDLDAVDLFLQGPSPPGEGLCFNKQCYSASGLRELFERDMDYDDEDTATVYPQIGGASPTAAERMAMDDHELRVVLGEKLTRNQLEEALNTDSPAWCAPAEPFDCVEKDRDACGLAPRCEWCPPPPENSNAGVCLPSGCRPCASVSQTKAFLRKTFPVFFEQHKFTEPSWNRIFPWKWSVSQVDEWFLKDIREQDPLSLTQANASLGVDGERLFGNVNCSSQSSPNWKDWQDRFRPLSELAFARLVTVRGDWEAALRLGFPTWWKRKYTTPVWMLYSQYLSVYEHAVYQLCLDRLFSSLDEEGPPWPPESHTKGLPTSSYYLRAPGPRQWSEAQVSWWVKHWPVPVAVRKRRTRRRPLPLQIGDLLYALSSRRSLSSILGEANVEAYLSSRSRDGPPFDGKKLLALDPWNWDTWWHDEIEGNFNPPSLPDLRSHQAFLDRLPRRFPTFRLGEDTV